MRHNALQGPITSIAVGLSAMEARHRPCGDGKVVDDRDDDNAPGVLAIRAGAKFGDDQPLDLVLGLREFFHDPHNNRLGLPGKIIACGLCGVTEGETQWRIEIGNGDRRARYPKVLWVQSGEIADPGPPFKAPATVPGLTPRRSVAVAPQPTGASRVGNHGETKLKRALTQGAGIVSDLSRSKRRRALACTRCGAAMDEVVSIAPLAGEPGLIAYECPGCGYVTSVLFHPDGGQ